MLTIAGVILSIILVIIVIALRSGPRKVRDTDKYPYSVAVRPATENEGEIRRNADCVDELVYRAQEDVKTLRDNFTQAVNKYGDKKFLGTRPVVRVHDEVKVMKVGEKAVQKKWFFYELGAYEYLSYNEMNTRVNNYASGLRNLGLHPNDHMAIYDDTCVEWTLCEQACFSQSVVMVTVYSNLGEDGMVHALVQCEVRHVQTNASNLSSLLGAVERLPSLKHVIYRGDAKDAVVEALQKKGVKVHALKDVEAMGAENLVDPVEPSADDLAVIMYTSGSTGNPKGVMISHANMIACLSAVSSQVELTDRDYYLSYLPLAHVLALAVEGACINAGVTIGYGGARTLTDSAVRNCKGDLSEFRPTVFAAVPTVYDKVRSAVLARIAKESKLVRWIFANAYRSKLTKLRAGIDTPWLNALVFNKFKSKLGGRVRFMVTGGAPLSDKCLEFLRVCFSAPVLQGYGLTETCGGGTLMAMDDIHTGRTGPPVHCAEIKLVDVPKMNYVHTTTPPRGEIYIRGPHITKGYYKNPEKTAEAYVDGWFRTGDIGEWTPDGTLKIIDRVKNLIKPPHGEYIAVEKLESVYKCSKFVANICIYADSHHNDVLALVNVDHAAILDFAKASDLPDADSIEMLCKNRDVVSEVLDDLQKTGRKAKLKSIELVRNCTLYAEEWTPENGMLTAAMKLKRIDIQKAFREDIDRMYGDK